MTNIEVPELKPVTIEVPEGEVERILKGFEATADVSKPKLTAEQKESLYAEAAALKAKKEDIDARLSVITDFFRTEDYGTQTVHAASGGQVTVGRNPIFNRERFEEEYPIDATEVQDVIKTDKLGRKRVVQEPVLVNKHLYKVEPNRPEIKRALKKDAEKFYDAGAPKVTFK